MDLYFIEHEEQHTVECLKYAGKFGKRYCIAQCLDARREAAQPSVQAITPCSHASHNPAWRGSLSNCPDCGKEL